MDETNRTDKTTVTWTLDTDAVTLARMAAPSQGMKLQEWVSSCLRSCSTAIGVSLPPSPPPADPSR